MITDFERGRDKIDLRSIDAVSRTAAEDACIWKGTAAFNDVSKGEVRHQMFSGDTMVWIDTDADAAAEMAIRLDGRHSLAASDFLL